MVRKTVVIVILLAGILLAAGCTESGSGGQDNSAGNIRTHYDYKESWGATAGCYGKVTGYVYNAGNASADNVQLHFNLINTRTGTIRDSQSVFIGTMSAGQSRTYEVILDGECLEDYRVEPLFGK
jgi:hypothetical protein